MGRRSKMPVCGNGVVEVGEDCDCGLNKVKSTNMREAGGLSQSGVDVRGKASFVIHRLRPIESAQRHPVTSVFRAHLDHVR